MDWCSVVELVMRVAVSCVCVWLCVRFCLCMASVSDFRGLLSVMSMCVVYYVHVSSLCGFVRVALSLCVLGLVSVACSVLSVVCVSVPCSF